MERFWGHEKPWFPCDDCNTPLVMDESVLDACFVEEPCKCDECGAEVEWSTFHRIFQENWGFKFAANVVGAHRSIGKFKLSAHETTAIDLEGEFDVPETARILHINTTPQGNVFPAEQYGNDLRRHRYPRQLRLHGVPLGDQSEEEPVDVSLMVTWLPEDGVTNSKLNLFDAVEAFEAGKFKEAFVPGNVAVETETTRLVTRLLQPCAPNRKLKRFVKDAGYSHLLNVVLPGLLENRDVPLLNDNIRGQLNRLRKFRNDVAHGNELRDDIDRETVSKVVCAAVFGHRYMWFVRETLELG